jgi:DNA polymerase-3 subunit epsilon
MSGQGNWFTRLAGALVERAGRDRRGATLSDLAYTVLDAEMTGLDPERDELLALGAVRMVGTRLLLGASFYQLIRPQRQGWGQSVTVHGIRPVDVVGAPPLEQVLPEFLRFCASSILVGHGVEIDRKFLQRAAARCRLSWPKTYWVDTGRVARWLITHHGALPEAAADRGRFSLEDLLAAYEIEPPARHHALADAFVTALVWQRQLTELAAEGVRTLRDLRLAGLITSA